MPSEAKSHRQQKGWHYRGYLPHFDADTVIQLVTFRLADSLPKAVFDELAALASNSVELRQKIETLVDDGLGSAHGAILPSQRPFKAHCSISMESATG
jgi:hypothetical protein